MSKITSRKLTAKQVKILLRLMYNAFLEIRILGRNGEAQQCSDLANAIHNIPLQMLSHPNNIEWELLRGYIQWYREKYPDPGLTEDYEQLFEQLFDEN